jgi:hypothetical protein
MANTKIQWMLENPHDIDTLQSTLQQVVSKWNYSIWKIRRSFRTSLDEHENLSENFKSSNSAEKEKFNPNDRYSCSQLEQIVKGIRDPRERIQIAQVMAQR